MKIAITADLHLRSRQQTPARYAALENIFSQLNSLNIETLIIAGDLFDKEYNNFSEFETICRSKENQKIQILIIPGNHDPNISQSGITTANIRIFSQPEIYTFDKTSFKLFFIPYSNINNIGEVLANFSYHLQKEKWGMVCHGDWLGNARISNSYEKGTYMPLCQRDIDSYKPIKAFMGHIHSSSDGQIVVYPGSPCGIDITETGKRRFITYDIESNLIETHHVETEHYFFNGNFIFYPVEDEQTAIRELTQNWIDSWGLTETEKSKALIRIKLRGYTSDKNQLHLTLLDIFKDYKLVSEPDLSELSNKSDQRRSLILNLVKERIPSLNWPEMPDEPDIDQIFFEAIKLVYEG